VTERSADADPGVSVSVALLLPEVGSVVPEGGATVAVLTKFPVADDGMVPVSV